MAGLPMTKGGSFVDVSTKRPDTCLSLDTVICFVPTGPQLPEIVGVRGQEAADPDAQPYRNEQREEACDQTGKRLPPVIGFTS